MKLLALTRILLYFNSIKVRLKRIISNGQYPGFLNFNSIKVRLKHYSLTLKTFPSTFQFHKGTIKTAADLWRV